MTHIAVQNTPLLVVMQNGPSLNIHLTETSRNRAHPCLHASFIPLPICDL